MEQIAILGFGCAGYHCLKTLRAYGSDAQVDVYTDTDLPPCNPMLTTYYVKGKIPYEALFPFGSMEDIQKELHFTWFPKTLVEKLDASTKTLTLPDGTQRRYDKILLATGTHAFLRLWAISRRSGSSPCAPSGMPPTCGTHCPSTGTAAYWSPAP